MYHKIKSQRALTRIVQALKRQGKRIVTYNGSFDILHAGHAAALEAAKKKGDVLIVLLNSDSSVRLYKGPLRPIIPQEERAALLASLASVDYVTIFDELTPEAVIRRILPHIHCKSAEHGKNTVERRAVEEYGGKISVVPFVHGLSSSRLIQKIVSVHTAPPVRAVFLDRDGTINDNWTSYIHRIEDFRFLPGVIPALRRLSRTPYKIIIATNQAGIGRGYYSAKDLERLHRWFLGILKGEGIRIDKIYHCPHHPEEGCLCRKPGTGMFLRASRDFGLNLSKSWMVGDEERDVGAGRGANLKTIKLGGRIPAVSKIAPNYYAKNLRDAVRIISAQIKKDPAA